MLVLFCFVCRGKRSGPANSATKRDPTLPIRKPRNFKICTKCNRIKVLFDLPEFLLSLQVFVYPELTREIEKICSHFSQFDHLKVTHLSFVVTTELVVQEKTPQAEKLRIGFTILESHV